MLATTVAMAATPALAEGCQVGPPQHHKGPLVFLDYDQLELDASYDQVYYEPLIRKVSDRLASNSESMRARIGTPQRAAYGPTEIEKLDVYRTNRANAPIFIHSGAGHRAAAALMIKRVMSDGWDIEKAGIEAASAGMVLSNDMAPVWWKFIRDYFNTHGK